MWKMKQGDKFQTSFYFFKKLNMRWKGKWSGALFQYILIALILPCNKNKLYKTLDHWSRDMVNSIFSEKGLGLISPLMLCMIFQGKCFSCYIPFIVQISLSDYLYFSGYWVICVSQLFYNKANLVHEQKVQTKTWIS